MRGYCAWLARMVRLGRVDGGGLRLRERRGMIDAGERAALTDLLQKKESEARVPLAGAGRARIRVGVKPPAREDIK